MLRWSVLVVGLASSGCVLGDGIDLPSTHTGPAYDMPSNSGSGSDGLVEGGTDSSEGPLVSEPGAAQGTGGTTSCCDEPELGGASGADSEEGP